MSNVKWMSRAVLGAAMCSAALLAAASAQAQATKPQLDSTFPNYQPTYPDAAQVNGEQGNVVLKVKITAGGRVRGVTVAQSSGFEDLDDAAVAGVLGWRYHPATEGGDTVSSETTVTIAYHLPTAASVPPAAPKT